MTMRKFAKKCELSPSTVYQDIKRGRLRALKLSRGQYELPRDEVYDWAVNRFLTAEVREHLAKNCGAA
jgi:excisionase family DNA binding protein